jgi:hypothetical protein
MYCIEKKRKPLKIEPNMHPEVQKDNMLLLALNKANLDKWYQHSMN